jgi:hypothetical protein
MDFIADIPFHTPVFFGFYLPPFMLWAVGALLPFAALRWVAGWSGLYRFVWHRPLFDAALYIIVLGMVIFSMPLLAGGA